MVRFVKKIKTERKTGKSTKQKLTKERKKLLQRRVNRLQIFLVADWRAAFLLFRHLCFLILITRLRLTLACHTPSTPSPTPHPPPCSTPTRECGDVIDISRSLALAIGEITKGSATRRASGEVTSRWRRPVAASLIPESDARAERETKLGQFHE